MPAKSNAIAVIAVVLAVLLLGRFGATLAQAAEMDCDTLIGKLKESGEFPKISINPADETVGVVTSEGSCSESIEAWSQRPPLPKTKPRNRTKTTSPPPRPRQRYLTPQPDKYPVPEPPKSSGRTAAPVQRLPATPAACDRRLENFWNVQVTKIEGVKHWLSRVFTLDMNGDRQVDNVSFTFKDKTGAERIVHYFGVPGGISGSQILSLSLPDNGSIKRLCFGDLSFEKPEHFGEKPMVRKWIEIEKPDLAGQMEAKEKGVVYKPKVKKKEKPKVPEYKKTTDDWVTWGGGLAALLAAAGGGVFFIRRRKKSAKGDDEDDDDEDSEDGGEDRDEDGQDRKSKKGLGSFFDRFKKKSAAKDEDDEDGDEDGDEDEDGQDRKSKKGLGSFFDRFKKKSAAKDEDDEDEDGPSGAAKDKPAPRGEKPEKKPKNK